MRRMILALVLAACAPAALCADNAAPIAAFVAAGEAEVYSGLAEPRYVTQTLPRGTPVEVYRQEEEWLAIRPPEGSFSWVPAQSLTMTAEPGVAEANADEVSSWIGSSATRVQQHQTSVSLKRGERVEVLGKKEVENADGQREVWLKIAPPAGEFRWLHASQVSQERPADAVVEPEVTDASDWIGRRPRRADRDAKIETETGQVANLSYGAGSFHRSSMELSDIVRPEPVVVQAAYEEVSSDNLVRLASHQTNAEVEPQRQQPLSPDGFVPRKGRRSDGRGVTTSAPATSLPAAPAQTAAAPTRLPPPTTASAPITPIESPPLVAEAKTGGIPSNEVQRRLDEIDVALSLMISRDRSQWNLAALRRETERLIENGATPIDRGQARFMLEKLERFAEAFGVEDEFDGALDLPVGSPAARKAALEAATAPKYDGVGYLTPVRAARPVAPYALLDKDGKRVCYVTPQPGFNLREYENRKIGIFGKRGYVADANAPHLLAERVVDLDKQVR